jgi:hypothetical protein
MRSTSSQVVVKPGDYYATEYEGVFVIAEAESTFASEDLMYWLSADVFGEFMGRFMPLLPRDRLRELFEEKWPEADVYGRAHFFLDNPLDGNLEPTPEALRRFDEAMAPIDPQWRNGLYYMVFDKHSDGTTNLRSTD